MRQIFFVFLTVFFWKLCSLYRDLYRVSLYSATNSFTISSFGSFDFDWIGFERFVSELYRVFTGFLPTFTGFYWVLLGFTGFYLVLLRFTEFYWVLLGFTEFYWVLLGFIWFYWVLLDFTEFYKISIWVLLK